MLRLLFALNILSLIYVHLIHNFIAVVVFVVFKKLFFFAGLQTIQPENIFYIHFYKGGGFLPPQINHILRLIYCYLNTMEVYLHLRHVISSDIK